MSITPHRLYEDAWPEGDFRFFQVGHVVDDVVDAAARWAEAFGVGPFHVLPPTDQRLTYADGERVHTLQIGVAQAGPVQVELIGQLDDSPGIYREWSRNGASAFHQFATMTPHYDDRVADYADRGFPVVAESRNGAFRVAYIDTAAVFGFYTEVVEDSTELRGQIAAIADTCATWDGTDPVRLLTRDGYRVPGDRA